MTAAYWCEHAWLPAGPVPSVRLEVADGRFTRVEPGTAAAPGDHRLDGLVLPGLANAHSHAFHRALRGRTHDGGGTFWTWRRRMYDVAARLDPDSYLALARATYAEMALAGVTAVGEFHYLHHGPGGVRYDDPNAMSHALVQAARDAGIRLTLLDTCYLAGGLDPDGHLALDDVQVRFSDGDAGAWAQRVASLADDDRVRHGVAVHSVRAVPAAQLAAVAAVAARGKALHVHLSEQPAENEACRRFYGRTPTNHLAEHGILGPRTTAVHATHLTDTDVATLAATSTGVCACPSTEADLADGVGPFTDLRSAGVRLSLGSDQHVVTDLLGEARLMESHERLTSGQRGRFSPGDLVDALTVGGHLALGWGDARMLHVGHRADLVSLSTRSPSTAGADVAQLPMVAGAADVHTVVVDGRVVVQDGRHVLGDVGRLLSEAIDPLWERA